MEHFVGTVLEQTFVYLAVAERVGLGSSYVCIGTVSVWSVEFLVKEESLFFSL